MFFVNILLIDFQFMGYRNIFFVLIIYVIDMLVFYLHKLFIFVILFIFKSFVILLIFILLPIVNF